MNTLILVAAICALIAELIYITMEYREIDEWVDDEADKFIKDSNGKIMYYPFAQILPTVEFPEHLINDDNAE